MSIVTQWYFLPTNIIIFIPFVSLFLFFIHIHLGFKSNARFYALNLLEELDAENEVA